MNSNQSRTNFRRTAGGLLSGLMILIIISACTSTASQQQGEQQAMALPTLKIRVESGSTYRDYSASLEGKVNVEIRPQVDGYLDKIYVDEGAYVKAGQTLFKINDRPYQEQLSNATANLAVAQANLAKAELEVSRLTPLVEHNVVSEVQLKTAQAAYQAAQASVAQAEAMVENARIDVGYTRVTAPVSGYIGRIPYKTGSLVGRGEAQPLTVLSEVDEVYAYFSMSEIDFLHFKEQTRGNTIEEKLKQMPPVELVMSDNSIYPEKGKVETMEGQFDRTMGSVSFRAIFPNANGLLRSGNTGKIRIPQSFESALIIPQEATFEIQDKVFVFAVADSNKVVSKPISIAGKTTNYYFVDSGVKPGEEVVFAGTGNLQDGMVIKPQPMSADSLLKANPL